MPEELPGDDFWREIEDPVRREAGRILDVGAVGQPAAGGLILSYIYIYIIYIHAVGQPAAGGLILSYIYIYILYTFMP